jgi:hypothetical protein
MGVQSFAVLAKSKPKREVPDIARDALAVAVLGMWAAQVHNPVLDATYVNGLLELMRHACTTDQFVISRIVPEFLGAGLAITGHAGWIDSLRNRLIGGELAGVEVRRSSELGGRWPR